MNTRYEKVLKFSNIKIVVKIYSNIIVTKQIVVFIIIIKKSTGW